jgi:uncharacterized Fe-S cluster protein YjdI
MQEQSAHIIVHYDPAVCTHAGRCVQSLPSVFNVSRNPWIDANGASPEEIVAAVARCPSGALTCELVDRAAV